MIPRRSAVADPALRATVVRRVPLYYSHGADVSLDRPPHVRAGSGLAGLGDRLALVQDDANFIAVIDPVTHAVRAIPLPADADGMRQFDERRGTKQRDALAPLNATCDVDWPTLLAYLRTSGRAPAPPTDVVQYELGELAGIPLGFTDAARWGDRLLFSAAAEDSPSAVLDGRVAGSVLGVIDPTGDTRWTVVTERAGEPFVGKVEGIAVAGDSADRVYAVIDVDDPAVPSELCVVEMRGPWR